MMQAFSKVGVRVAKNCKISILWQTLSNKSHKTPGLVVHCKFHKRMSVTEDPSEHYAVVERAHEPKLGNSDVLGAYTYYCYNSAFLHYLLEFPIFAKRLGI